MRNLIDRKNRCVTSASEATMIRQLLKAAQDLRVAVGIGDRLGNPIPTRSDDLLFRDPLALVLEERVQFLA